jgi:hypothetical protein
MLLALQNGPVIVTLVDRPSDQTTFADVLLGAFGITGILVAIAVVLGGLFAFGLVKWHQRHRPEDDHMPSVV